MSRPLILIPARFSASASALRYSAIVTAQALSEAVYQAGGEPLTVHPVGPADRFNFAAGVLLPGGGDLHPDFYGQPVADVYDVSPDQDTFDIALASWTLTSGRPLLAICRGLQVVNVLLGGTLEQSMPSPHRHLVHTVAGAEVSCFHHQRIARLGTGLAVTARASDGTIEAVSLPTTPGWFRGVQWHPEDTPSQGPLFDAFIAAAQASTVPPFHVTPTCR